MLRSLRLAIAAAAYAAIASLALLHAGAAHAVLITFDELPPPTDPSFDSTPVTDQYRHLGLTADWAYLAGAGVNGPTQSLLGGPYFRLMFSGPLPTYVSMFVSAPNQDRVSVTAYGPGGSQSVYTDGWAGPHNNTPYRPNQYVSFHAASGISQVNLDAFFFLRVGAVVDNLYFGNVPAVPLPASSALLAAGLAVLSLGAALNRRRNSAERAAARPTR